MVTGTLPLKMKNQFGKRFLPEMILLDWEMQKLIQGDTAAHLILKDQTNRK